MTQDPAHDLQTTDTLTIIEKFHTAFNRHDVDAIMALMAEDCIFENTAPAPDGARVLGQDAVRQVWIALFRASPNAHFAVEEVFACRDRGVLRWTYTWHNGLDDSGHVRGVDIFRVDGGKVAEKFSYVKG